MRAIGRDKEKKAPLSLNGANPGGRASRLRNERDSDTRLLCAACSIPVEVQSSILIHRALSAVFPFHQKN